MERPNSLMDYVKLDTCLMRSRSDAEYIHVRQVLLEHGVDLGRAVVACYYNDGGAFYGAVVTPDQRWWSSIYSTLRAASARSQENPGRLHLNCGQPVRRPQDVALASGSTAGKRWSPRPRRAKHRILGGGPPRTPARKSSAPLHRRLGTHN